MPIEKVKSELRHKSDSKVDGLSVKVRGTDHVIHADGSVTKGPALSDGQLQHRADAGASATILFKELFIHNFQANQNKSRQFVIFQGKVKHESVQNGANMLKHV